ncbi:class I SAM-dependent methyltransferase [Vulcanococcus limneticus]|uniref:class I SAM-dependent methyltransferase n=1 Tax=Vulcanococcus limneticus TaxID=2170428 RepID=UPI00398BF910
MSRHMQRNQGQACIALSNWERSLDFHPMRAICHGNRILDLGCHTGLVSFEALQAGASHVTGVDQDSLCINIAQQQLGPSRATLLRDDLSRPNVLSEAGIRYCILFGCPSAPRGKAQGER